MISVITLTYNKRNLLLALADSLMEQTAPGLTFEWIVIDNGTDGSGTYLKEHLKRKGRRPKWLSIVQGDNRGNFASMTNRAVKDFANGDVLFFLNNDVVLQSDALSCAQRVLDERPNVSCVGGVLFYPKHAVRDGGLVQHAGIVIQDEFAPANLGAEWLRRNRLPPEIFANIPKLQIEFQAVTAACMAMRRADFEALGGFREEFHWCFDDVDLGLRVTHELKKICVVDGGIRGTHIEAATPIARNGDLNWRLLRGYWNNGWTRPDSHLFAARLRALVDLNLLKTQTKQSE